MKIGLIDVDSHRYPNLALMKISSMCKSKGYEVEWYRHEEPMYDVVFMAKVFSNAYTKDLPTPENAKQVVRGGTGYAIELVNGKEVFYEEKHQKLPFKTEHIYPDYSLYPEYTGYGQSMKKQISYGFLTRGCPRGCEFCIVKAKEGQKSVHVANLDEFWKGQGNIVLQDPNLLACSEWKELLDQLVQSKASIELNQGLDARLITLEKAELLAKMRLKTPHFAMDSMKSMETVKRGLKLYVEACKEIKGKWNWRNGKVFMITNFDTTFEEDMERVRAIQECECYPYVMIYNKPSAPAILRRLQRWTNNVMIYSVYKDDFFKFQREQYKEVVYA